MGFMGQFARRQSRVPHVCFGSEADRFTPESRHQLSALGCPPSAVFVAKKLFGGVLVQVGALLINHIAPRRRTLTPSA
jgi:hypothetical protein